MNVIMNISSSEKAKGQKEKLNRFEDKISLGHVSQKGKCRTQLFRNHLSDALSLSMIYIYICINKYNLCHVRWPAR